MRSPSIRTLAERVGPLLEQNPALPLCVICVGLALWMAGDEGGFNTTTFLLIGVIFTVLLLVGVLTLPRPRPSRLALAAVGLLAAYALWSYLSITWAPQKNLAWDGANRTVLYAVVFAVFALWPLQGRVAVTLIGIYALGVGVIGVVEILRALSSTSAVAYFHEGRFSEPTGYANANVALWFSAFLPCVVLAARRELPAVLRGLFLGSAGILLSLSVLGQSRSWFFVLPLVAITLVVVVPGRGRNLAALAVVAVAAIPALSPLLSAYETFEGRLVTREFFESAARAALLLGVALFIAGTAIALVDRTIRLSHRNARRLDLAAVAVAVAIGLAGIVAFSAVKGNPVTVASDQWSTFKAGGDEPQFKGSRIGVAGGTYRYDFWRVAWENFTSHPIKGVGADNFGREYLRKGKSQQTPSYPHSVELRALSQTGLIGTFLLLGALVCAAVPAASAVRRARGLDGTVSGIGLLVFAYFILHGSLDWLWEFAGLGVPAFAWLGIATARTRRQPAVQPVVRRVGAPVVVGAVAATALIVTGFALPWLAARDIQRAREEAATNLPGALDRLDAAARLNPLDPTADTTAGLIDASAGNYRRAREHFAESLDRDDSDSLVYVQLAAIASAEDRPKRALPLARRAVELNPKDEIARTVLQRVQKGTLISPRQVNALIRRNIDVRIGPT